MEGEATREEIESDDRKDMEDAGIKRRRESGDKEEALRKRSGRVWEDHFTAGEILALGEVGPGTAEDEEGEWQVQRKRRKRKKRREEQTKYVIEEKNNFDKIKSKLKKKKKVEKSAEKISSLRILKEEKLIVDEQVMWQARDVGVSSPGVSLPVPEVTLTKETVGGGDPQQVATVTSVDVITSGDVMGGSEVDPDGAAGTTRRQQGPEAKQDGTVLQLESYDYEDAVEVCSSVVSSSW